jgi:hypothetical protein
MITGAVDAYFKRDKGHYGPFHSKLTTLLAGKDAHWQVSEQEKKKIWESIMLWNYVPVAVAEYSRKRPTPEMFRNSRLPFNKFMEKYLPEAALVCGYDTWGWLMNERPEYPGSSWDTPVSPLYQIDNTTFARMRHPSGRGFNYAEARTILNALLLTAGGPKWLNSP